MLAKKALIVRANSFASPACPVDTVSQAGLQKLRVHCGL